MKPTNKTNKQKKKKKKKQQNLYHLQNRLYSYRQCELAPKIHLLLSVQLFHYEPSYIYKAIYSLINIVQ